MKIKRILYNTAGANNFLHTIKNEKKIIWVVLIYIISLILLTSNIKAQTQKFDVRNYYELNNTKDITAFFKDFPYEKYLETTGIDDIQQLEKDRFYFWQKFNDGDPFLYNLEDHYVINNSIKTLKDAEKRISLAEKYLDETRKFDPIDNVRINPVHEKINEIYFVVGHFLMATSARWIGEEIKLQRLNADSTDVKNLVERMKVKKILIELPETLVQKIQDRSTEQTVTRAKSFIENHKTNIITGNIIIIVISVFLLLLDKFRGLLITLILLNLASLGYILAYKSNTLDRPAIINDQVSDTNSKSENTNAKITKPLPTHCKIEEFKQMENYDVGTKSDIKFLTLINKETDKEIGQFIKMSNKEVKVAYFINHTSNQTIYQWLDEFKQYGKIVLITSGGYSNSFDQPEGLTFQNGNLINAVLLHDRKALIKIKDGNVDVENLKGLNLQPVNSQQSNKTEDSFVSLSVYSSLIRSLQDEKMTSFQTHLLAYKNELKIDPSKSDKDLAERRLLALVKSKANEDFFIIINVKAPQKLGEVSENIFNFLSNQEYEVKALVNLDTGKYNILEVFNSFGVPYTINNEKIIKGTKDMTTATNLLVFYIEN